MPSQGGGERGEKFDDLRYFKNIASEEGRRRPEAKVCSQDFIFPLRYSNNSFVQQLFRRI